MIEMVGEKFNKLLVISLHHKDINGRFHWLCKCDCGSNKIVEGYHLRKNKIKSCGCLRKEKAHEANIRHGANVGYKRTSEYMIWCSIKSRCFNKKNKSYKYYGGKGITMSDEWKDNFLSFYNDMGKKPNGYSIERINNNGNYCKENCKWIKINEQARNKSNTHKIVIDGISYNLSEISEKTELDWDFLYYYLIEKLNERK